MSAMDKLHSSMSHCQLVEAASRLSKIPNAKKRLTEIIRLIDEILRLMAEIHKLTNEANKKLANLRADYDKEAKGE